jgi:hypothetical protein
MSQDAIERALTELAARADTHPAPDVVRAVHRRARRNAAVRATATATAVVAVVAGASVLVADGLPFDRGAPPSREVPPSGPRLTVELHPSPDLAASLPRRQPGIPVVVEAVVRGDLPTGPEWPVERSILGLQTDWGDGGFGGTGAYGTSRTPDAAAAASCPPAGQLRGWESAEPMTHYYERPGTYTVTYRILACGLPAEVTRSIEVTVTETAQR